MKGFFSTFIILVICNGFQAFAQELTIPVCPLPALYVLFDSEIMEGWAGLPDPADLPAVFYVDYCRVWQSK